MEFEEKVDPAHTAVLVVDMQNDFCSRDGAYDQANPGLDFKLVDEMVPRLASFLDEARANGVKVLYIQAIYNADDDRYMSPAWLEHAQRRRHGMYTTIPVCKEGGWGAEIISPIAPREGEMVMTKHRYSAFIDTPLTSYLRNLGIQTVLVTGVGTNGCVESTARDAFMLDHYVVVVEDCVATYWKDLHDAALKSLGLLFGEVRPTKDIVSAWDTVKADRAATAGTT
jgi:ureidoacrylate peracid hydrolase